MKKRHDRIRKALAIFAGLAGLLAWGSGVGVAHAGLLLLSTVGESNKPVPLPHVLYRPQHGNPAFRDPKGIAIDSKGNVWVANAGSDSVTELFRKGGYRKNRSYGGPGAHFDHLRDLVIDRLDDVWVVSRHGVTALYAKDNYRTPDFYSQRHYSVHFRERYIAVDPAAPWPVSVFVTGSKRHTIHIYGTPGKNIMTEKTDIRGRDKGASRMILEGVAADGRGHLWIANRGGTLDNDTLKHGHLVGDLTDSLSDHTPDGKPAPFRNPPVLLAFDPAGNLWYTTSTDKIVISPAVDRDKVNVLYSTDPNHPFAPAGIAVDGKGTFWFVDHDKGHLSEILGRISHGRIDGSKFKDYLLRKNGETFFHPRRMAIDNRGNVWLTGDEGVMRANPPDVAPVRTPLLGLPKAP